MNCASAPEVSSIMRYLARCYRDDTARSGIWNCQGSRVSGSIIVEGYEQLLQREIPNIIIRGTKIIELQKEAEWMKREREMLYGFLILKDRKKVDGFRDSIEILAPLILVPVTIHSHENVGIAHAEMSDWHCNREVLDHYTNPDIHSSLADQLENHFRERGFGMAAMHAAVEMIAMHIPKLDGQEMLNYPALSEKSYWHEITKKSSVSTAKLFPGATVFLSHKPIGSAGIIHELDSLTESTAWSAPLHCLFADSTKSNRTNLTEKWSSALQVPVSLTAAQEELLYSSRKHPISVIVGPPGTGKSFTSAALAVDHLSEGRSVLLVARNAQALEVLCEKVDKLTGEAGVVMRSGEGDSRQQMLRFIRELLRGTHNKLLQFPKPRRSHSYFIRAYQKSLKKFLKHLQSEIHWHEVMNTPNLVFQKLRAKWALFSRGNQSLQKHYDNLTNSTDEMHRSCISHLCYNRAKTIRQLLQQSRSTIVHLRDAMKSNVSGEQNTHWENLPWETMRKVFPLWICELRDIHRMLPMQREMFDLVVFDEAGQCDLASCLPAMQRAKRIVVAGDPHQLRHISFLSRQRMSAHAQAENMNLSTAEAWNYREKSLLDFCLDSAPTQNAVGFLHEHFRCHPSLISFNNDVIYGKRLAIMKSSPWTNDQRQKIIHVAGERNSSGENIKEAESIISWLTAWYKNAPANYSMGIITPFRAQAELLEKIFKEKIPSKEWDTWINLRQLRIATVHGFQGDERDVMIISTAITEACSPASLRFLEQKPLFNVMTSRAREQQVIFTSVLSTQLPSDSILRNYLERINTFTPSSIEQISLPQIQNIMMQKKAQGFEVYGKTKMAGRECDLVWKSSDGKIHPETMIGVSENITGQEILATLAQWQRAGLSSRVTSLREYQSKAFLGDD